MAKETKKDAAASGSGSIQDIREELAYLRSKCSSLTIRGRYGECVKTIEENLKLFYTGERWPEHFFSILRIHQKCYPSLDKDQPYEEYLTALLKKNGIPFVFARLLRERDSAIAWTAEHFRDLAAEAESREELDDALSYSDLIIKIDPRNAGAYLIKGEILSGMNRDKEALEQFQHALELNPANKHALNAMARYYLKADPAKALAAVEEAIQAMPDEAAVYALKAEVLRKMNRDQEALEVLSTAMTLDPYNPEYPYQRGEILFAGSKPVTAVPQYRMAIALNGRHVPSLMRLTQLSFELQPDIALGYANSVVAQEPGNLEACLSRAKLLYRTGETDAAVRQYQALLDLDPDNSQAHGDLGAIYLAGGEAARAMPLLVRAVELAPRKIQFRQTKARAHKVLGERDAAIAEYREALALNKRNPEIWGQLGALLRDLSPKEALDHFEKALALDGENPFYLAEKAFLLLQVPGREAAAVETLSLACRYDPGNAELHAKLGRLLEDQGSLASAMSHYKKALALQPEDPETAFRFARLQMDANPDQAYLSVGNAIALSVTRGDYYYVKAQIIVNLSQDADALEKLEQPIQDSDNLEAINELAQLQDGNFLRVALIYIDRAIELDPENPAYLCMRAHLFYCLGQKPKALTQYEKLLAKDPDQPEALFGMGRILAGQKGQEGQALEYLDRAIRRAPAVAEYHGEKAELLARDPARYQEALAEYDAAIAINNQAWQVLLAKARLLDSHGDLPQAMAEYRHALLIRPDCAEATGRMGVLLADLSPAQALPYLNQAVKLEPEAFLPRIWRAKAYHRLERTEDAHRELEEALSLGGESGEAYYQAASILADLLTEDAVAYCQKAISQDDSKAEYHLLMGDLLLRAGNREQAKLRYQKAAQLDGGSHPIQEKLAQLADLMGEPEAIELVTRALESKKDCPACLHTKAMILEREEGDVDSAIEFLRYAVELEPNSLPFREKLVELLGKKRSFLKLAVERRRLEKLRRQLAKPIEIPDAPDFERAEEE